MSAPLTVQTVSMEGSVEPSQEGRCTCLTAGLLSGLRLCTRIRTAGQAETGTASSGRNASGHWTSSFLSAMVDGQARWLKEESPGFIQGSVKDGHHVILRLIRFIHRPLLDLQVR